MKKAKANVSVKINGKLYRKGTVLSEPFPEGIQAEIDATRHLPNPPVTEISAPEQAAPAGKTKQATREPTEAEKKKALAAEALETYGVKLDTRKSLKALEEQVLAIEEEAAAAAYAAGHSGEGDAEGDGSGEGKTDENAGLNDI